MKTLTVVLFEGERSLERFVVLTNFGVVCCNFGYNTRGIYYLFEAQKIAGGEKEGRGGRGRKAGRGRGEQGEEKYEEEGEEKRGRVKEGEEGEEVEEEQNT